MDDEVYALAVSGTDLYAGGVFNYASGTWVYNIAKWNGSAWSSLGSGVSGKVYALAVSGTDLYVGGELNSPTSPQTRNIAKWNGSAWSALGSGVDRNTSWGSVNALAVSGTDLYVGGDFTTAGGIAATNIAKWNGNAWSPLSLGLGRDQNGFVNALALSGTDLYAGGYFPTAGGVSVNNIAKWNGSAWSSLSSGMDGSVSALAVSGTDLYAGGSFYTAGGTAAASIAKWDGSAWSALGSGMGPGNNASVSALAVSGTDLYAGGGFTTAGDKVSAYVAKAMLALGPAAGLAKTITVSNSTPTIVFKGTPGSPYDVQRTPSLKALVVWTTLTASSPLTPGADGLFSFTDTNAPSGTAYYRSGPR
jgi:hypothetical protein